MLKICFTADHELFFGNNMADAKHVFIEPTYRLMEVLERYQIPLCLMTDVCSILRYKELNVKDNNYVDLMEEQLRYAIRGGHDVQLHIHPHWLTSNFNDGKWEFDYSRYRLHSFGFSQTDVNSVQSIIMEGKEYLLELLTPVDPEYNCIAFRAGGLCIQPEQELFAVLHAAGIKIDSSVFHGGYRNNFIEYFDFRKLPSKANWWVNPQKGLPYEADENNGVFEVAIGSYHFTPMIGIRKLWHKKHRRKLSYPLNASRGATADSLTDRNKLQILHNKVKHFLFQPILFEYDAACAEVLKNQVVYLLKQYDCGRQDIYISIIGHPKTLTSTCLKEIDKFCAWSINNKPDQVGFIRFRDIILD